MSFNFVAPHNYNSSSRKIAIAIKQGEVNAILSAAEEMAEFVTGNAILVPMPSHFGYAIQTFRLAQALSQLTGAAVCDILKGKSRDSLFNEKKRGHRVKWDTLGYYIDGAIPSNRKVYVIDNCIDTGASGKAAASVIGDCTILAYAMTKKTFR